ncbi:MAG: discoidin domain-containing protein [Tannerella sp.]|nr:discoidin domain-containing protein [Tannerella sp.]
MKNLMKIIYRLGMMVCLLCASCSDMNELSDRFLGKGETTYAVMPDSVAVGAGKERVKFEVYIKTNRVKTIRIYWNNRTDSTDIETDNTDGVFSQIIENLREQSYLFNVVNIDSYGNKSLPYEISGRALGEKYESAMVNRRLISIYADKSGGKVLEWGSVDESLDVKYSEVSYTNVDGRETVRTVPLSEAITVIPDIKSGSLPKYRTIYIPDEMAIDLFYTPYRDGELKYPGDYPLLKSDISIIGYSNQHDNGNNAARNAFDGNYNNRWHSQASANYPHWMAFDLAGETPVSRISIWPSVYDLAAGQTYDNRLPATVTLWGRTDTPGDDLTAEDGWINLGTYNCEDRNGEQTFVIDNPAPVRYLKVYAPGGLNGTTMIVIGEIDIYTK